MLVSLDHFSNVDAERIRKKIYAITISQLKGKYN